MSDKIRCIIVDNDPYARTLLQKHLQKLPSIHLVGVCQNALEALELIQAQPIDLILLDIDLPEVTGIEMLHILQVRPMVIFTTTTTKYAMDGYELDIVDYLLKPIRFDKFVKAINKAKRRMSAVQSMLPVPGNHSDLAKNKINKDYLLIKSEHKVHKIKFDQICYIQGMKEYVAFNLYSKRILSLQSLKSLEKALPEEKFIRIHKSYIVAVEKVNTLEGNQIYIGPEKLPIGSSYKERVINQLF